MLGTFFAFFDMLLYFFECFQEIQGNPRKVTEFREESATIPRKKVENRGKSLLFFLESLFVLFLEYAAFELF